jgi:hypothetical protein
MLNFGQLYVNDGIWQGKQLIPEQWVMESFAAAPPAANTY